jgi:hypothetical protein
MSQIESVKFLRRAAAAEYLRTVWGLRCSPSTLAKLSCTGPGPVEHRAGKTPLYAPETLDAWAASRISGPICKAPDSSVPEARAA